MQNASAEEREALRYEWQKRVPTMSQEERQEYMGKKSNREMNSDQGMKQQGYEKGYDDDNYNYGKGKKYDDDKDKYRRRERSGEDSGYGSGNGYEKGSGRK